MALPDTESNTVFKLHFIRLMRAVMEIIRETLLDARDIRSTNEYYDLIYEDIDRMSRHLEQYWEYNEEEDSD